MIAKIRRARVKKALSGDGYRAHRVHCGVREELVKLGSIAQRTESSYTSPRNFESESLIVGSGR